MNTAITIARSKIGQTEATGNNDGPVVRWCMDGKEGADWPWCGGFVTQPFMDAGQDAWLQGLGTGRYNVDAIMDHGKKNGLNTAMGKEMPVEGALVSFRAWGHIGMVTKVETNAQGEKMYHITHGNSSRGVANDVVPASQMKDKFFEEYVDSRKIDAFNRKENPNVPPVVPSASAPPVAQQNATQAVFANVPTQQQITQQLQTSTAEGTYNQYMGGMPPFLQNFGLQPMFGQLLVAAILLAAGAQSQIPSQQNYQQDPNAGIGALQNIDRQRAQNNGQFLPEPPPVYRKPEKDPASTPATPAPAQQSQIAPPLPTPTVKLPTAPVMARS
ncbi:MAG: hypothetical protein EAZ74_01385 [Alphaproteobacteria bacterium]|nr:MAG: hypothetical protein EAY76_04920 [Alphaproteobacteria bacterium]TAF15577.1 MAG: hypothetical protein EAZ74_01385 [Alphaproteobacteria bacterium]TAF41981.1 MAG: hypothetical protein EAZ66_00130 [Alphaproteobacteria bacterium]TAF76589.1 MAG: hypothetical protein EAZ52_03425 [Alphaproteobacteria bacterium]